MLSIHRSYPQSYPVIYSCPDLTMVGFLLNCTLPLSSPVASMDLTTANDWSSATSPKTTCLPSSQLVTTVVTKNWEPLLWEQRSVVMDELRGGSSLRVRAGVGHGEESSL